MSNNLIRSYVRLLLVSVILVHVGHKWGQIFLWCRTVYSGEFLQSIFYANHINYLILGHKIKQKHEICQIKLTPWTFPAIQYFIHTPHIIVLHQNNYNITAVVHMHYMYTVCIIMCIYCDLSKGICSALYPLARSVQYEHDIFAYFLA